MYISESLLNDIIAALLHSRTYATSSSIMGAEIVELHDNLVQRLLNIQDSKET